MIQPPGAFDLPSSSNSGVEYRLYFIGNSGRIMLSHEFEAEDDAAAIEMAEGWREGRIMELWQRARMVCRWE